MAFVAIYTVGRLRQPYEHPASREFFEVGYKIMRQASMSGRLIKEFTHDGLSFPKEAVNGEGSPILTLTVWESLQSLYRFTYSGKHKQALRDRNRWMDPPQEKQPNYVVWWTETVKDVSWEEASKRYNYYMQHGSTPFAFDYTHAFDETGAPFLLN